MTFLVETMIVAVIGFMIGYYVQPIPDEVLETIRSAIRRRKP